MSTCYKINFTGGDIDFDIMTKSLGVESNIGVDIQDAVATIKTALGSNRFYTDFGCELHTIIGEPILNQNEISSIIEHALLKDSRYKYVYVTDYNIDYSARTLHLKAEIGLYNSNVPLEIETEVSE